MVKIKATLLVIFAALTIILLVYPDSAAAAEDVIISASKVEGSKGGQVEITLTADNVAGSEGGQFILTYDQSLVKPLSIEPGDLVLSADSNLHMANLDYAPGELIFMWVTAKADTNDSGVVCRLTFELLKEGTTAVGIKDLIVVTGNGAGSKAISGEIKVSSAAPGQENATDSGPAVGDDAAGEEVIGEDNGEEEKIATPGENGVNPLLVVVPIIIIVTLAVVYYLTVNPGKKKKKNKKTENS